MLFFLFLMPEYDRPKMNVYDLPARTSSSYYHHSFIEKLSNATQAKCKCKK